VERRAGEKLSVKHNRNSSREGRAASRQLAGLPPWTALPNYFVDELAPIIPAPHFKALVWIWRKILGWQKDSDFISLGQIERGAGVSRSVAWETVRIFENAGLFGVHRQKGPRRCMRLFLILKANPTMVTRSVGEQVKFVGRPLSEWPESFGGRTLTCSLGERTSVRPANTQKETLQRNGKDGAGAPHPQSHTGMTVQSEEEKAFWGKFHQMAQR